MVRATQPQAQALLEPQAQAQAQAPTTTSSAEEEALKRKTDCVYFLASPLTCKKGSECEYRHSDIARVNPRDCWYWLNGNCLNPKCAFRHPPLDGLLGTQVPTLTGSSVPPSQTATTTATHAPYISAKQAVPCIFFQKGLCLKGDKCSFIHAPNATNNKAPQVPAAVPATEHPTLQKAFGGLGKCTQEQKKISPANVQKFFELPPQPKVVAKAETAPTKTGAAIIKIVPPPSGLDNELPRYRPADVLPATNGNSISRSNRVHQTHVSDDHSILNGQETEEFSREPSPGFDVLVDDELGDSDYYQNEDQFGRTSAHEGRNLNPMNDYDLDHPANFNSMADVDRDMYHDPRGYDSYEHGQGRYAWDQRRASADRMLGGSAHMERRRYPRTESPDRIEESDLRHRLSKQRGVNGLRSVITHDHVRDDQVEDQSYIGLRRETQNLPSHESSLSSRLRGRIKIPGRSSSPVNGTDLRPEREMDRGRNNRGRLSPGRPQIASHQGRIRDRIKARVQEDFENEGRNFRGGLHMRRDLINNDGETDFAGPKSLAQLKVGKNAEGNEQQLNNRHSLPLGKRKYQKMEDNRQDEAATSFEGPKPLSLILKKKREADTTALGVGLMSGNKDDSKTRAEREKQGDFSFVSNKEEGNFSLQSNSKEEFKRATSGINVREVETEEGMIVDVVEAMADHVPEVSSLDHQRGDGDGGDSEYEQVDGEDYDGENAYPEAEEEYLDDDDNGDDFEKKVGVMFL